MTDPLREALVDLSAWAERIAFDRLDWSQDEIDTDPRFVKARAALAAAPAPALPLTHAIGCVRRRPCDCGVGDLAAAPAPAPESANVYWTVASCGWAHPNGICSGHTEYQTLSAPAPALDGQVLVDNVSPELVQELRRDWLLYGEMHLTNANGLTRLDPRGITYDAAYAAAAGEGE